MMAQGTTAQTPKPVTLESLATDIVQAVNRAAPAGAGRPCKLGDHGVALGVLTALWHGKSKAAAAKTAGVTEGALRLWLKQAADGSPTYAPLRAAIEQIAKSRMTPRPVTPEAPRAPSTPQPPPLPDVSAVLIARWRLLRQRRDEFLRAHSRLSQDEGATMAMQLRDEMKLHGMTESNLEHFPGSYRLNLPRNLAFDVVKQRYLRWCEAVGLPGPTDFTLEPDARAWYRDHCAPLDETREPGSHTHA